MSKPKALVAMSTVLVAGAIMTACGAKPPTPSQTAKAYPTAPAAQWAANGQGVPPAANSEMPPAANSGMTPAADPGAAPAADPGMAPADPSTAPAQSNDAPSIVGAWSGQSAGQGGVSHGTDLYNADGTFVSVSQLPNGTMQRFWGLYRVTPVSPYQLTVEFQLQGVLPRQICAQTPGFPMGCRPYSPPAPPPETVTFTSPTTLQVNGITMQRDNAPYLLQQNVPQRLVMNAQAPVQPHMRQPVMTGGARYNSAPAQSFINGYMRGCVQNAQGQWVGCQQ
jgi:hypothetical protein